MNKLKVSEVARLLGISPTAVYKKLRTGSELVRNQVHRDNGVTYITEAGYDLLKKAGSQPGSKPLNQTTSADSEPVYNLVQSLEKRILEQQNLITSFQKTIDNLVNIHAEERSRSDVITMKLANDISNLQKTIEYKKSESLLPESLEILKSKPTKNIIAWRPEKTRDPLDGMSVFEKILVRFFRPEKLRRFDF